MIRRKAKRDASETISLKIAEMPPSANAMRIHFIRNGKINSVKSKAYAAWKEAAAWELASARVGTVDVPYRLYLVVQRNWRSKRARDIDNIIKPVSDALVAAGVLSDDSLAESVSAEWADDLDCAVRITIEVEIRKGKAA